MSETTKPTHDPMTGKDESNMFIVDGIEIQWNAQTRDAFKFHGNKVSLKNALDAGLGVGKEGYRAHHRYLKKTIHK